MSSLQFLEPPVEIGLFLRVGGTPGGREGGGVISRVRVHAESNNTRQRRLDVCVLNFVLLS